MTAMKTMLAAALTAAFVFQASPGALAADGRRITLYGEGAQVLEEMTVKAAGGEAVFLLPSNVDASSLRITAKSGSVYSIRTRTVAVPSPEGSLTARLKELRATEASLTREKELLELRRNMLAGAAESFVQAEEVGKLDDLLARRGADFDAAMRRVEKELADTAKAIELASRDIKASGLKDDRLEVRAGFADASGKPVSGSVEALVAYELGGCGWSPRLDVRADTASGTVTVTRMAGIQQKSGMDWDGAHLILAEGLPERRIGPRSLSSWRIEPRPEPVARERNYADGAKGRMMAEPMMMAEAAVPVSAPKRSETASSQTWDLGVRTVKAGMPASLLLDESVWKADFYRLIRPRQGTAAWLAAKVELKENAGIAAGEARYSVDGTPVGTGSFGFTGRKGIVYFGADAWVTASMDEDVRRSGTEGMIIGRKNTYEWKWNIKVKNSHSGAVKVRVEDSVPTPGDKRIIVAVDSTPAPQTEGRTLVWEFDAAPGETAIVHAVKAEAPSDMKLDRGR